MRRAALSLLIMTASVLAIASEPPVPADVADALVARIQAMRVEQGAPELVRKAALDAAALARAREAAAAPEGRRLAQGEPLEALLRVGGVSPVRHAASRIAVIGGFEDPAATAVEQWTATEEGRKGLLDPRWESIGTAAAPAGDGVLVLVAVLVQDEAAVKDPRALERATEDAVNRERRARKLLPLEPSEELRAVARAHSDDMARRGFLGHVTPDGSGPATRMREHGIAFRKVTENISASRGVDDPVRAAVDGWLSSPGHLRNLADPEVSRTGVGVAVGEDGTVYFTQIFLYPEGRE